MALEYDHEKHAYTLDGALVPSVSRLAQVVSPMPWIKRDILEAARELGSYVHDAIDLYQQEDLDEPSLDEVIVPYLTAWKSFLESTGFQSVAREEMVASRKFGFAGRLDIVGWFPKRKTRLAVIDIKTGEVLGPVGPQTAGYALAWNEEAATAAMRVRDRYALRLKGDGSYSLVPLTNPRDFAAFQAALVIQRWRDSK